MRRQKKDESGEAWSFCTAHLIRHEVQGEHGMREREAVRKCRLVAATCVIREPVLFPPAALVLSKNKKKNSRAILGVDPIKGE